MNRFLMMCLALGFCSATLAHDHDHDHDHEIPTGTLFLLEGQDRQGHECFLFVMEEGAFGPGFEAKILTNDSHGHFAPEMITVRTHPQRADALFGRGSNGQDEIAIMMDGPTQDLRRAKSFAMKWLHDGHFHYTQCRNLRLHED